MSQRNVQKWLTKKKGKGGKPLPKKKQRPFPVTKSKIRRVKQTPKPVTPTKEAPLGRGRKATIHFKFGKADVEAEVRWETQKVDPMVNIGYFDGDVQVFKKYKGPKKRVVWEDRNGKEHAITRPTQKQVMPDGQAMDITPITQTKDMYTEVVDKGVMNDFLPSSYLELWSDKARDQQDLQQMAIELVKSGKVAAVSKFAKSAGTKVYVGFIYPVLNPVTDEFSMEMMVSENVRKRRRWMSTTSIKQLRAAEKAGTGKEVEVPKLW